MMPSPRIERTNSGYTAVAAESGRVVATMNAPVTRDEMYGELAVLGCHPVDILEELSAADHFFERGLNAEARYFDELQRKSAKRELAASDIAWLVDEIERDEPRFPRSSLLYMVGRAAVWTQEPLVAKYLYEWVDFNDATTALHIVLDWGLAGKYRDRIRQMLRGDRNDTSRDLQSWTFAILGWVLSGEERGGSKPPELDLGLQADLLEAMIEVAEALPVDDVRRNSIVSSVAQAIWHGIPESTAVPAHRVFEEAELRLVRLRDATS